MKKQNGRAILGENVRSRRESLNFTQKAFARYTDLHRSYLGRIERGEQNLTLEILISLAGHLEISVPELTEGLTDFVCLEFVESEHQERRRNSAAHSRR